MEIDVLWKLELPIKVITVDVQKLCYIDFQLDKIDGIFRVCNSDGVNLNKCIYQISQNLLFFRYLVDVGVCKVFEESNTFSKVERGWEWQDTTHHKLAKWFCLDSCVSWFTIPFGGKIPDVKSMHMLYPNIQSSGVKLLYSWNDDRQPSFVCYFFPIVRNA
jgi:hypothetical protein